MFKLNFLSGVIVAIQFSIIPELSAAILYNADASFIGAGSTANSTGGRLWGVGNTSPELFGADGAGLAIPIDITTNIAGSWSHAGIQNVGGTNFGQGLIINLPSGLGAGQKFELTAMFSLGLAPAAIGGAVINLGIKWSSYKQHKCGV